MHTSKIEERNKDRMSEALEKALNEYSEMMEEEDDFEDNEIILL